MRSWMKRHIGWSTLTALASGAVFYTIFNAGVAMGQNRATTCLYWVAAFFASTGLEAVARWFVKKAEKEAEKEAKGGTNSTDPYRDPTAGLQGRMAELEQENEKLRKQSINWDHILPAVFASVLGVLVIICIAGFIASHFKTPPAAPTAPDAGVSFTVSSVDAGVR